MQLVPLLLLLLAVIEAAVVGVPVMTETGARVTGAVVVLSSPFVVRKQGLVKSHPSVPAGSHLFVAALSVCKALLL